MEIDLKNFANVLGTVGSLTGALNPVIGSGIVLAGKAIENLNHLDDSFLEEEFVGLSQIAKELQFMIDSKDVDFEKLQTVVSSLYSLSVGLNKFSKMIG